MSKNQPFVDNGIKLSKISLSTGDQLEITYKGLLSNSGADEIFLYGGYGAEWKEKILLPMQKDDTTFKAKFKLNYAGEFHFTFKDPADNWDNNSGNNYTITIGKTKAATATKVQPETKPTKSTKTTKVTAKKLSAASPAKKIKETKAETTKSTRKTTARKKS